VKNTWPDLQVVQVAGGLEQALQFIARHPGKKKILLDGLGKWKMLNLPPLVDYYRIYEEATSDLPSTRVIRRQPYSHHHFLLPVSRAAFVHRIALVGPESCGKSFLAEKLAAHYNTVHVEEYGRTYCEKFGMDSTDLDFAHVAGGQLYREDEMALQANKVLFCDTELLVTQIWSEVYFKGKCQPWIYWANHERHYAHFLLCAPDIPWVNDGLREFEYARSWMFDRLLEELECRQLPFSVIHGGFEERWAKATVVVEQVIGTKGGGTS
jgi:NadR type nicotinamide-nucleotide adenylyltransferase